MIELFVTIILPILGASFGTWIFNDDVRGFSAKSIFWLGQHNLILSFIIFLYG
jgi:hypothetical protein